MNSLSFHHFLLLVSHSLYFATWSPLNTLFLFWSGGMLWRSPEIHRHYLRSITKPLCDWLNFFFAPPFSSNKWVFSFFPVCHYLRLQIEQNNDYPYVWCTAQHSEAEFCEIHRYFINQGHNCWMRTEVRAASSISFLGKQHPKFKTPLRI